MGVLGKYLCGCKGTICIFAQIGFGRTEYTLSSSILHCTLLSLILSPLTYVGNFPTLRMVSKFRIRFSLQEKFNSSTLTCRAIAAMPAEADAHEIKSTCCAFAFNFRSLWDTSTECTISTRASVLPPPKDYTPNPVHGYMV